MPDKCRSWLEPCVCEGLSSSRCWPEVGQAVRSEFPFSWSGTSSASLSWSSAFSSNTCATRTCEGVNEIFVVWNLRHLDGRKGEYLHLLTASSEMASLPCMAPGAALPNCSSLDFLAGASALGSRRLATWSKMRNSFSGNLFCQSHHRLSLLCLVHFLHVLRGGAWPEWKFFIVKIIFGKE